MKKILCCLSMIVSFLFINSVNAEELQIEINKDDIAPGTYIIGEHMFNREKNEDYNGTLYVEYMLAASKTISSTSVDNMKVYYNSPKYGWVNPMNNEVINEEDVPATFNITYKNSQLISGLQYGDVNGDGEINIADGVILEQYISNWNVKIIEAASDLNSDGKITKLDSIVLSRHIDGWETYATLPIDGESLITYGDVNEDRKVDIKDAALLEKAIYQTVELNPIRFLNADLNKDNILDQTDLIIMLGHINEVEGYETLPYLAKMETIAFGDVNGDNNINVIDTLMVQQYVADSTAYPLTKTEKLAADVNFDGIIDDIDYTIISRYIADWAIQFPIIQFSETASMLKYGDVNYDGEVNVIDRVTLEQYLAGWDVDVDLQASDVNKDGKVNVIDQIILIRHLAGWDDYQKLPYQETVEEFMYGDLDGDKKVTVKDSISLAQYLEDSTTYPLTKTEKLAADLNLDKVVDDKDATILSQYIANWGLPLPYVTE